MIRKSPVILGYRIHHVAVGVARLSFTMPIILPGIGGCISHDGKHFMFREGSALPKEKRRHRFILALGKKFEEVHTDLCLLRLECLVFTNGDMVSPRDLIIQYSPAMADDRFDEILHGLITDCWQDQGEDFQVHWNHSS
ncbi:MAG TPA: hypothetical protein VLF59_00150 [Candidatus Saccharimonadales bacterium]|nr:hypothetical protein [Candidatus Saccharimonadales bacterium]